MRILMVTAELSPLAKTGGLGDAVAGLSGALAARGHDVRVLMPRYAHLPPPGRRLVAVGANGLSRLEPAAGGSGRSRNGAASARNGAPTVTLLELGPLTGDAVYMADERDGYRFLSLAEAALDFGAAHGFTPDVVHCHDWHAALVPDLLRAAGRATPTVLTLHNIGYQGVFDAQVLGASRHPRLAETISADARANGSVNFLRAGLRSATALTTVSPTYAREIRTPAFGMGLETILEERHAALTGILNGVDYETWSPASDPLLDVHYDAEDVAPKAKIKDALCADLRLEHDPKAPLLGVVSRLVAQKGIDLVAAVLPQLLAETRVRLALLGSGDDGVAAELTRLAAAHPRRVSVTLGYDERLAHRILAGSDLALVPSRYEPCGLTQMYALRYGTIPVVRATGGLADTVEHFDAGTGKGTGSVFRDADAGGLLWGIRTALGWLADPKLGARLMANAMRADFSWQRQVLQYEAVYRDLGAH
jgi:starch synthase